MDPQLQVTLFKLAGPIIAIVLIPLAARRRGVPLGAEGLGLQAPDPRALLGFLALWTVWCAGAELLIDALGLEQPALWPAYPAGILALRILAIGVLGPISEELVMRGMFWHLLQRTRLGPWAAVVVTAVIWAGFHVQYTPGLIALIAADGIVLGAARVKGGSLWIPIAMHVGGNLFSIGQSLGLV